MAGIVAYVLIRAQVGGEYDVAVYARNFQPEVTEALVTYGSYDVVVRIETDDMARLDEIVTKLRKHPLVKETVTLVASP
ncbi:MAG: Lrp/AsnC ligand binding domain-containing protein [Desulfurococcales archaeon]|nr:Lrp/AsnC ligand binding domain-containing protein [Desulfurococcales archaeon]